MAPLLPNTRLIACPACREHIKSSDAACPHCGAELRSDGRLSRAASAVLMGLALAGCPDKGGDSTGSNSDGTSSGSGTDATDGTSIGGSTTGTGGDITSLDPTVAEPEYGVPFTTGTGGEPDYGVPATTGTGGSESESNGTVSEPEYGVPSTTGGPEPDYGVPSTTG